MAAPPSERDSGAPALTEAQFGTTSQGAVRAAERKTAFGGVIFVALGALAVGLVAGLVALPRYSQFGRSEALAPLPAPLPPTRDARPKKAAKAGDPEPAASTSAQPESSADAVPSASAGALSSAEVKATKPDGRRDDQEVDLGDEPSSVPPTAPTPWVKPDWARPDDEPIIRRPPIQDP
jgi:hypothetical protein